MVGLAEGKVKACMIKPNKSQPLFGSDSFCVSISASPDGNNIVVGFLDHSLMTYNLETKAKQRITHTTIPYALAWGTHILAAGNDGRVAFYD